MHKPTPIGTLLQYGLLGLAVIVSPVVLWQSTKPVFDNQSVTRSTKLPATLARPVVHSYDIGQRFGYIASMTAKVHEHRSCCSPCSRLESQTLCH